jgi:arsenic resistance protein ArsH
MTANTDRFLDTAWHTPSAEPDWVADLELDTVAALSATNDRPLRLLVLYGSLRERSYSRLMAFEAARILRRLGADVKVFQPASLPLSASHPRARRV